MADKVKVGEFIIDASLRVGMITDVTKHHLFTHYRVYSHDAIGTEFERLETRPDDTLRSAVIRHIATHCKAELIKEMTMDNIYTMQYRPPLDRELVRKIKATSTPAFSSEDTGLYNLSAHLESDKLTERERTDIETKCETVDYIEL